MSNMKRFLEITLSDEADDVDKWVNMLRAEPEVLAVAQQLFNPDPQQRKATLDMLYNRKLGEHHEQ